MKPFFRFTHAPFVILGSALLLVGCSKSSDGGTTSIIQEIIKPKGLRIGMEYQNNNPSCQQQDGVFTFVGFVYVFGNQGVSVYQVVSQQGDVYRNVNDGSLMNSTGLHRVGFAISGLEGGKPRGTQLQGAFEVLFGPGDRVPILENAVYKVDGTSVYVDWSQHHSAYFSVSGCNSGSEVLNMKNDGLILESATSPGFILTLNMAAAPDSVQDVLNNQANELRKQNVGPINP